MRLLLYGGTFDPPHNGHLNNLRAAAARVRPDRVVVMPAGLSPFKQSTAAPGSARVEMCACFRALEAEGAVPALCVSGWEVEQAALGRRNYTVLTLEMLARTYPEAELYMAMGSDMLLSFDSWHRWQEILRLARLVVTSRNVGDAPELHAAKDAGRCCRQRVTAHTAADRYGTPCHRSIPPISQCNKLP